MAKFTMDIECDNAAFCDDDGDFDPNEELSRIIGYVKCKINDGHWLGNCYDTNGNKVGRWEISDER